MPEWSGKSKGGTLGYRIFIALIRHTSITITYFFIRIVAVYYLLFSNKGSTRFYFRKIHNYGRCRSFRSIYRNYCMLGEVLVDKVAMLSGAKTDYTFSFEGEEHLRTMSADGKGGILIGAHMGNWEVAGQLLERINTPVNIVMHEAEHEQIKTILDKVMVNRNIRVIPRKEDYSHLFLMEKALNNNEFLVIHGDRYTPGANTIALPFLGKTARFPSGPLYLASKKGVPVTFVYTLKERKTHYHFYATPGKIFPYPARIHSRKEEIRVMVEAYVESLEAMVNLYPLQWFNYYPFWEEETS
ncbi:MAG: lipid A biosynthesis acyltransferase [Bacteroidetes bacterium]|nr:lipid A biosynthesis acyltransferase [Bacteroidota bacterium]